MNKKKVAYLGIKGLPSKGGAERVVEGIVNHLSRDFDLSVYASKTYARDYDPGDIRLIRLANLKGKHVYSFSLSLLSALHALFFEKFDLIHVHNTDSGFIVPLLRLKYNVIGTSHGYAYKREKWSRLVKNCLRFSEKLFFTWADEATCVSKSITDELKARYGKPVHFIPNGIERPAAAEDPPHLLKHRLKDTDYICFAAGRVDPTKGCHILLEAFKRIDKDVRLAVIGDFSHKQDYSEQLYSMADERTAFIPFIEDREVLFGIIKKAKLFVFPSTVEAMSIMLLEVAALGVPIICSDIPENLAVLEGNTTYFRSGDAADLAGTITRCLEGYADAAEQAGLTKEWVVRNYDWKNIAKSYKNLYNKLTD